MKKAISYLLYILFFGFAATLIISCIILMINMSNNTDYDYYNKMEAVIISDSGETQNSQYQYIDEISLGSSDYYKNVEINYGYNALSTDEEKYLYDKIMKNVYHITDETDENGHYRTERLKIKDSHMSEYEIRKVVNAFSFDNPQIFWLENLFGYAYAGNDTIIEFYSLFPAEECTKYIDKLTKKVDEIVSSVNSSMSEYEREKYIHDTILKNCSYKTGVTGISDGWQYFSAYGALIDGEAVCEGYAKSMQILLSKVGIECYVIRGEGDGIGHMWNVVKLDGKWYHLDATWNDSDDGINYEYFNLDTEKITKNHTINEVVSNIDFNNDNQTTKRYNFFVPMCVSDDMNYYTVEGYLIDEFNDTTDDVMISLLRKSVQADQSYIYLRFGNNMTYSEYIDSMFYKSPYKFYYYVQSANEGLDNRCQIDKDTVSVLKNESAMTVRIKINIINKNE